jgi:hypothetical protein
VRWWLFCRSRWASVFVGFLGSRTKKNRIGWMKSSLIWYRQFYSFSGCVPVLTHPSMFASGFPHWPIEHRQISAGMKAKQQGTCRAQYVSSLQYDLEIYSQPSTNGDSRHWWLHQVFRPFWPWVFRNDFMERYSKYLLTIKEFEVTRSRCLKI